MGPRSSASHNTAMASSHCGYRDWTRRPSAPWVLLDHSRRHADSAVHLVRPREIACAARRIGGSHRDQFDILGQIMARITTSSLRRKRRHKAVWRGCFLSTGVPRPDDYRRDEVTPGRCFHAGAGCPSIKRGKSMCEDTPLPAGARRALVRRSCKLARSALAGLAMSIAAIVLGGNSVCAQDATRRAGCRSLSRPISGLPGSTPRFRRRWREHLGRRRCQRL